MVVGTFPSLFGTTDGTRLQSWCLSHGWVLLWALGPNTGSNQSMGYNGTFLADARKTRAVDPIVAFSRSPATINGTAAAAAAATATAFAALWDLVGGARTNTTTPQQVRLWQHARGTRRRRLGLSIYRVRFNLLWATHDHGSTRISLRIPP